MASQPMTDEELEKFIEEELEKTPAYSVQLTIYKEDPETTNWNARLSDNLGTWSSDDFSDDGFASVPAAVLDHLSQLLEAMKNKQLVQGVLGSNEKPRRREAPKGKTPEPK